MVVKKIVKKVAVKKVVPNSSGKPVLKNGAKSVEIVPGASLVKGAEEIGVPFSCYEGVCDTCEIEVVSGGENLTPKTENEKLMGIAANHRLTCQCKMKKTAKGTVEIRF